MDTPTKVRLLKERLGELDSVNDPDSAPFHEWYDRTEATLRKIFGAEHHYHDGFRGVSWQSALGRPSREAAIRWFQEGKDQASSLLKAAIYELETLIQEVPFADEASIEPGLWEHLEHLIQEEEWAQVASQACIYTESTIRQWAGRPESEYGEGLTVAVLKNGGEFPLGKTPGERDGWFMLGMGFAKALRNVDAHRIQDRPDLRRYALGVMGTASLLLTQLRYEHGNRFRE